MAAEAPPLTGLKVLELGGLAPGPFCGLLLASYGASVLRIDRTSGNPPSDNLTTYKASIPLDLKESGSIALLKSLIPKTDVLIDPYRPGILEKLGLDPHSVLLKLNPRLVVVRLTGFRKDGKYKDMAGHDINYLAVSGVLSLLGARGQPPLPPTNILADFAGGGLVAFTGVLLALINRGVSGRGQVVDANMVDGASYLATFQRLLLKTPMWEGPRGTNPLDGGAPFYGCYECKDEGRYVSVGALEPQFFAALLKGLDLKSGDIIPPGTGWDRNDKRSWEYMRKVFEQTFKSKTRAEWEQIFDGTDACVAPVLAMPELEQRQTQHPEGSYEQRPIVGLERSPSHPVADQWVGHVLQPGEGGEERLHEWMGWTKGNDFVANAKGAFLLKSRNESKL